MANLEQALGLSLDRHELDDHHVRARAHHHHLMHHTSIRVNAVCRAVAVALLWLGV